MTPPAYAVCDACARLRPLRPDGLLACHYTRTSATATGRRRRKLCPGSRRPPRRAEP
jgi:hypothetical protein